MPHKLQKELKIKTSFNRDNRRDTGPRINNRIFAKSVQVISSTGQNLGIMPTSQALQMAADEGLDLVEISVNGNTTITKIMDFGKFKYEQKKRASEARKNQKTIEMKEVWVKPFIEENDLNIKMKKVFEFLGEGNKVKIAVMTRGSKKVLARGKDAVPELFARILEIVGDKGTLESKSKPDERTKSIIIAPAK
ncbi:MAG TPA: translation initiation factor IF-3 [Candidatus Enterousia avicola]|uniref:Translation initiation factor IF-3 n=1 Tax=Candidatus Enterousia avicola TaxID=2840787 RepID=A0A9D1SMC5_9PROT|nr:translation initiation factor IF-3 [Candidatus Enterousia avicola]